MPTSFCRFLCITIAKWKFLFVQYRRETSPVQEEKLLSSIKKKKSKYTNLPRIHLISLLSYWTNPVILVPVFQIHSVKMEELFIVATLSFLNTCCVTGVIAWTHFYNNIATLWWHPVYWDNFFWMILVTKVILNAHFARFQNFLRSKAKEFRTRSSLFRKHVFANN